MGQRPSKPVILAVFFLGAFVLLGVFNYLLLHAFKPASPSPPLPAASSNIPLKDISFPAVHNVVRKMYLDPSRTFYQSIFYDNGTEVARYKSRRGKIYDVHGHIPNGKVRFINEATGVYGEEYYLDGKRDGPYREYYKTGQIHRKIEYSQGKVQTVKEYFIDGSLRMEADYTDALWLSDNRETGKGKIYYRDGTLMYEWDLTNEDTDRYKRSYNIKGQLVEVKRYNSRGDLVEKKDYHPQ